MRANVWRGKRRGRKRLRRWWCLGVKNEVGVFTPSPRSWFGRMPLAQNMFAAEAWERFLQWTPACTPCGRHATMIAGQISIQCGVGSCQLMHCGQPRQILAEAMPISFTTIDIYTITVINVVRVQRNFDNKINYIFWKQKTRLLLQAINRAMPLSI